MDLNRSFETSDFRGNIYLLLTLGSVLLLAFWIRIQGIERFLIGKFTETDGYFYYWQTSLISDH
jgi:asparagine N-glycosylation enzyme membrane subunit Stt3